MAKISDFLGEDYANQTEYLNNYHEDAKITVIDNLGLNYNLVVKGNAVFNGKLYVNGALYITNKNFAGSVITNEQGVGYVMFDEALPIQPVVSLTPISGEQAVFAAIDSFMPDGDGNISGVAFRTFTTSGGAAVNIRVNYMVVLVPEDSHTSTVPTQNESTQNNTELEPEVDSTSSPQVSGEADVADDLSTPLETSGNDSGATDNNNDDSLAEEPIDEEPVAEQNIPTQEPNQAVEDDTNSVESSEN